MQTVNPSLLEKNADSHLHVSLKSEARRDQGSMDVLQRARQMGMKIWALEKLQRMITTINDNDIGGQNENASRSKNVGGNAAHGRGENDLSRVLRQELLNGPSDRDPFASMEMVMFKGPFIYIHDMNEKTKPVMVREYARVNKRQDGAWPQFRSAPLGKCPFIDEPPSRKEYDRHRIRQAQKEKKAAIQKAEDSRTKPSTTVPTERAVENKLALDISNPKRTEDQYTANPVDVFTKPLFEDGHERKSSESLIPPHFPRTGPFYTGREPAASGVQPSNVTSAIRSQMISSTAAAPGAKAGLSKEVHGLKRKVLEKGTGNIVAGSMAAPQRPSTGSTSFSSRQTEPNKTAVPDKNGHGDAHQMDGAGTKRRRDENNDTQPQKPERRRDPKPGYCENCRDKFDDFEEVSHN
jgi:regulatory subunit for Cdc7p protein kinase